MHSSRLPQDASGTPDCPHAHPGPAIADPVESLIDGAPAPRAVEREPNPTQCGASAWDNTTEITPIFIDGIPAPLLTEVSPSPDDAVLVDGAELSMTR